MRKFRNIVVNITRLLKIAWNEDRFLLIGYFLTACFSVVLLFLTYFFYKLMVDQVFKEISLNPSMILFSIIISYLLFEFISRFVNSTLSSYYFEYILRSKFQNALTRSFMDKLASLDFSHLEDGETRNLIAKVSDTYAWRIHDNLRILNYIVYNIAALMTSFFVSFRFGIGYFIVISILAAPLYIIRAKYGNTHWSIYTSQSKKINYLWYMRYLFTEFNTLSEIKLYQMKNYFINKTKKIQDKIIDDYKKPIIRYTILTSVSSLLFPIIIFFALKNFTVKIIDKTYSVGDFTFFLNILYTFIGQISNLLLNFGVIYENNLYVNDFFKLQDLKNNINSSARAKRLKTLAPRKIEFANVSFKYPGSDRFALKNINLTIKAGEDIAIVGHNGAGKTTLIKLIFRFYDPTKGKILINGVDLRNINLEDWYRHLSVLFQDFGKYNLSVKENVQMGKIDKNNDALIRQSIFKANGQDILKTKNGVNQILGNWFEDGQDLSVGQWQKVAIARALYREAPYLILDEPTSNIDPVAEYEIFKNLKNIYKQKNLIFISHRFSTVRMADYIYVLDKGEIIEDGTHKQLVNNGKLYTKFFNIQKKGYE